jgi:predicted amidohydrolase YtcJ
MNILLENCTLWPRERCSVFISDGSVARIGASQTQAVPADTMKIDAGGGTLLPGLTDSHCHPFELGWLKRNVDLRGTANITALRLRLAAKVRGSRAGEWVVGMGWDQEAFPDKRMPDRRDIDDLSRNNPVVLSRICGHIGLLNTRALEILGLSGRTGDEYERDSKGELTGILKERALVDAYARMPGRTPQSCADELLSADLEAARSGLCTLHCILSPDGFKEELGGLMILESSGKLSLRYRVYVPTEAVGYVEEMRIRERLKGDRVRINGVKLFADGSLGARTASLREPYSDDPGNSGLLRYTDEELASRVAEADEKGYQVIIHAIGDRAVEQALSALAVVSGGGNPRGHRIEHASLLPKDLRSKMAKGSIRAAVQPSFITSDTWAGERLGEERARDLYPLRSMLSEGILSSGGSDAPVETLSPVLGIWSAMVRGEYAPEECMDLADAVDLYTWRASANGLERQVGASVIEGAPANITLLDSDLSQLHPAMLRKVGVTATVVGGNLVYSALGHAV